MGLADRIISELNKHLEEMRNRIPFKLINPCTNKANHEASVSQSASDRGALNAASRLRRAAEQIVYQQVCCKFRSDL